MSLLQSSGILQVKNGVLVVGSTGDPCCCSTEAGPCYVRGGCAFTKYFGDRDSGATTYTAPAYFSLSAPGFTYPASGVGMTITPPGQTSPLGLASGARWIVEFGSSGFGGGALKARLFFAIASDGTYALQLDIYNTAGTTITSTQTASISGDCGGVYADVSGQPGPWWDRFTGGSSSTTSAPTAKAVTWSGGSGSLLLAARVNKCNCPPWSAMWTAGSPATIIATFANVQVCACVSTPSGRYASFAGNINGTYTLTKVTESGDTATYRFKLPDGTLTHSLNSDSACAVPIGSPAAEDFFLDATFGGGGESGYVSVITQLRSGDTVILPGPTVGPRGRFYAQSPCAHAFPIVLQNQQFCNADFFYSTTETNGAGGLTGGYGGYVMLSLPSGFVFP